MRDVLISPKDAFIGIKADPAWGLPAAIIAAVSILLGLLLQPFNQKIIFERLVKHLGTAKAHEALSLAHGADLFAVMAVPLVILGKCMVIAGIVFSSALVFHRSHPSWKPIVSAAVHAELILLLMGAVNLILVEARGSETVHTTHDLQPILGLDYVCRSFVTDPMTHRILQGVNIFTIWYISVLMCGVSTICGLRMWQSSIIVVLTWLAMTAIKVLMWQQ
jgi:hypothetical protein